jgi:glycosyltransferase involved in cell wall biosynthesis
LNALAVLRDQHSRTLSLVLVGSDQGNLAHVRRTVAELGLKEQVIVLGFVPRNELLALYGSATALAYVSFFGPENLPPLEALAIGCPVVAADVAGAREQLGDAALLVDPRRETEIATAILQLLDNPDLRTRLVAKGKQRAAQWTGREFVDAVLSAIDDLEPIRRCWP